MELKTLRTFLAVAEAGSFSKAAEALFMTQPSVSRQMRLLEEELGVRLFERHSHRVTLTPDGVRLRSRATQLVEFADRTSREFSPSGCSQGGEVYLGAGESTLLRFVGRVVQRVSEQRPGFLVHLRTGYDTQIGEWIDRGIIDFGILLHPADTSRYQHVRLPGHDVWGLLMRTDNPLASKDSVRAQDIIDEPLIVSRQATRRSFTNNPFLEWLGVDLEQLRIVATMDLPTNAAMMVQSGLGSVFTFEGLSDVSPESGLCFRPMEPRYLVNADLCWKKSRPLSRSAQAFLEMLLLMAGEEE